MKVTVTWTVTEVHSAQIEVPDDVDLDEYMWELNLAPYEGNCSYMYTPERYLDQYVVEGGNPS